MTARTLSVALLAAVLACSDDGGLNPVPDVGPNDSGETPDAGPADTGSEDAGTPDAAEDAGGTQNPEILFRGVEQVADERLYLEGIGTTTSTNNPVLLLAFLPGFESGYWVPEADFLLGPGGRAQPNRAVVMVDVLAQGRSGIASDDEQLITVEAQVNSLGNAITHLRENYFSAETRFDVIAHGYGALLSVLHEAASPGDFDKLIMVSPYPWNVDDWADWIANYSTDPRYDGKAFVDLQISPRCRRDSAQCEIDLFRIYGLPWVCEGNNDAFFEVELSEASNIGGRLIERYLRNTSFDYGPALRFVGAETTVITGDCDQIPERTFQTYTASITGAQRIRLPDAGFFPMTETRERFQRIVLDTLNAGR
jgi:pimeloyl-ACP methyl ester carboxylesterase